MMSTSWSHSLQQLKVTGLSPREGSSSGSRDAPHAVQDSPNHTWMHISFCPKAFSNPFPAHHTLPMGTGGSQWLLTPHKGISGFGSLASENKNVPITNSTKHPWTLPTIIPHCAAPRHSLGQSQPSTKWLHKPILRLTHSSFRTAEWKENSHFVQLQLCPDSKTHFLQAKCKGTNTALIKKKPGQESSLKFRLLLINRIT